jgi:poly-gamma-glutamate synthesis protein (capsule biosynthesis protein)
MSVTIALTGQCAVHELLDLSASSAVRDMLTADVSLANLEATVKTPAAWPTKIKTLHLAEPEALQSLRSLCLTTVVHANNHAFDLGPPGIAATLEAATRAGLGLAGSGADVAAAAAPARITARAASVAIFSVDLGPQPELVYAANGRAGISGLRMTRSIELPPERLAEMRRLGEELGDTARGAARRRAGYDVDPAADALMLFGTAFVPGARVASQWSVDAADRVRLLSAVAAEKAARRIVVLALHSHHWDADWTTTASGFLALAEELVETGVDVIAGTGAPVLQPVHMVRGRPVFSGLGNAVFHTARAARYDANGLDVWRGAALRLSFSNDGLFEGAQVLPIAVGRPAESGRSPLAPVPLGREDAQDIMRRLTAALSPADAAGFMLAG